MKYTYITALLGFVIIGCQDTIESKLPAIKPNVITEKTKFDSDDPAIWVNPKNPENSIVFGTDKQTDGAIYAFNLKGEIIEDKTIRNVARPNNVDVEYGFALNDSVQVDVLAYTEREKHQIRLFTVPDMKPIDGGGFKVFENETELDFKSPMGISLYKNKETNKLYAFVSRKTGPDGSYIHQYEIIVNSKGNPTAQLVREFGSFSGIKEIEAIAVDDKNGFVYYSDEQHCIKQYYADPEKGNKELACFGQGDFYDDTEGIAILHQANGESLIIVSDQGRGQFNIYNGESLNLEKQVNLSTLETDGCDVVATPLNAVFPNGLFVAMNDNKDFYFYDLNKILQ